MKRRHIPKSFHRSVFRQATTSAIVGTALLSAFHGTPAAAQSSSVDKLAAENAALKERLDALELAAKKEGIIPSKNLASDQVSALSEITLSGFVQASYFYNFNNPSDGESDGYLWNTKNNSFSINKVKVVLASPPAERSGEKWDAGFRVSMIYGEDAPVLNTGGEFQGLESLREAYVDLNAPLGDGLNIKVGQLISLLNYESGDGGAANKNFSQGYQWFYTGNGPSAGIQLNYEFTEWLDLTARFQNGMYAGAIDNNDGKAFMGKIGLKPNKDLWISLIGFASNESDSLDLSGGSILAGYQINPKMGVGFEGDYFAFENNDVPADVWSVGTWVWYNFTEKHGLAFRADYVDAPDNFGILGINLPGRPNSAITSVDPDGSIASFTLTYNWVPVPSLIIQPELRYDTTSYAGGYDGNDGRWILGAGVSYLF